MTREEARREAEDRLRAAGCPEPKAEAEVLLAHVLAIDRTRLLLERGAPLGARARSAFERSVARRLRREPVAYITGAREFWSLSIRVTPSVLIPRPETEILVQVGLELLEKEGFHGGSPGSNRGLRARVIDVGTGSGCVAIALAHTHPRLEVFALDRSARALAVAAKNVARHGLENRVNLRRMDLFQPVGGQGAALRHRLGPANLVVSNPPYVTCDEWHALPPEIRDWEPGRALLGGRDGLDIHRRLAAEAAAHIVPGGWIAVEVGAGQAAAVAGFYEGQKSFREVRTVPDLAGIPRVVAARRRA